MMFLRASSGRKSPDELEESGRIGKAFITAKHRGQIHDCGHVGGKGLWQRSQTSGRKVNVLMADVIRLEPTELQTPDVLTTIVNNITSLPTYLPTNQPT